MLVAGAHLDRALERLPRATRGLEIPFPEPQRRALHLLRNIYEHWDSLRDAYRRGGPLTKAAKRLTVEFPEADPWSLTLDRDHEEIIIADAVPLRALKKDLRRLEARVLRAERSLRTAQSAEQSGPP